MTGASLSLPPIWLLVLADVIPPIGMSTDDWRGNSISASVFGSLIIVLRIQSLFVIVIIV